MLTSKQKRFLKSKANRLRPMLQVGKNGLNDALVTDLARTLETHELLKINILQNSDLTAAELSEELTNTIPELTVVQVMGRVLTLYRPASKIKNRKLSEEVNAVK